MVIGENNDQPPRIIKHFCKVCNKGFSRGGALGGHMRSHGIEDINAKKNNEEEGNKSCSYFLGATNYRYTNYIGARDHQGSGRNNNILPSLEPTGSFKSIMTKYDSSGIISKEEKDMANCLVMLSNGQEEDKKAKEVVVKGNIFQCKACKKVFNSHQALGGHRASHKRVKGCFAARFENTSDDDDDDDDDIINDDDHGKFSQYPTNSDALHDLIIDLNSTSEAPSPTMFSPLKKKLKVHECSICHRVFSSGQALGGHKRCHWLVSNMAEENSSTVVPTTFRGFRYDHRQQLFKNPKISKPDQLLDLNLPTLFDHETDHVGNSSKFEALTRIYLPPRSDDQETREVMNRPKLSVMREMSLDGNRSTWLQVGIGRDQGADQSTKT